MKFLHWLKLSLLCLVLTSTSLVNAQLFSHPRNDAAQLEKIAYQTLPIEAQQVINLIQQGGPFPYPKDGSTFGNYEKRLPKQARGYYREYTVRTPGISHRGARRIVTGGQAPTDYYYTDDHYQSFRLVQLKK
jgi:ribonuclease T1